MEVDIVTTETFELETCNIDDMIDTFEFAKELDMMSVSISMFRFSNRGDSITFKVTDLSQADTVREFVDQKRREPSKLKWWLKIRKWLVW